MSVPAPMRSQWPETTTEIGKFKMILHKIKSNANEKGFTLLELLIAMFILVILLSVAQPTYQKSVQRARETVLKENLWQMRRSIDQYSSDKGKLPSALSDLVQAGYLRELPRDPITEKAEWEEIIGEDSSGGESQGLKDVRSLSEGVDDTGVSYRDY
jgi:general secretion pathway protein G